jgi:hypothetical protein
VFTVPSAPRQDRTANDGRSSLGLLPDESLAGLTLTGNETFARDNTFGFGGLAKPAPRSPPPPSAEAAEQVSIKKISIS